MSQTFWCGYPWQSLRDSQDFVVVTVDQLPDGWGRIDFSDGPSELIPAPIRGCFEFTRGRLTSYTPWFGFTVSPMVIPFPRVANAVDVRLVLEAQPGVTFSTRDVRL